MIKKHIPNIAPGSFLISFPKELENIIFHKIKENAILIIKTKKFKDLSNKSFKILLLM